VFQPQTFAVALTMMILSMFFWGIWPNTYKATRNWRFELFYWDYAFGMVAASALIGMTIGTLFGSPTFLENLASADRITWLYAFLAGFVWNCGNILLIGGVALVGLATAFPTGVGLALVLGSVASYAVMPQGKAGLLFTGVACVFVAVVLNSLAYRFYSGGQKKISAKGLWLCIGAGLLFSAFGPLVGKALSAPHPLSGYGVTLLFSVGALASTFPMMAYLMRRPVEGGPISWSDYRRGSPGQHLAGFAGALLWGLGTTLNFSAAEMVGVTLAYSIGFANPLVAALAGIFVWGEFKGAPTRSRVALAIMFIFYIAGLVFLAASFEAKH